MKKIIFVAALVAASMFSAWASNIDVFTTINLTLRIYDPIMHQPTTCPRVPSNPPVVYQDGHSVFFHSENFCDFIVLVDPDNEDTFVYTTIVPTGTYRINLPENLRGEYEIRFCKESYYYSGIIELE